MNPIASSAAPGRSEPARDTNALPADLASLFAAIFAATAAATAAQPAPVAVPAVPIGAADATTTPDAADEKAKVSPGGLPVFPAFMAQGRPHAGSPAPAGSLADLAQALRDAGDAAGADPAGTAGQPAPTTASSLLAAAAGALSRMDTGAGTKVTPSGATEVPGGEDGNGSPLSALSARDGGRPAPGSAATAAAEAGANPARGGRGKGRSAPDTSDGGAPAVPQAPVPAATPPPAAHAVFATPHRAPAEAAAPAGGPEAAPAPLPEERPQPANPSHATVAFDNGDGQEGRLRVSLRGNVLRATIEMPDAAAAQRLEQDSGSLTRALRAQGFDEARLVIDSPRAAGTAERGSHDAPREQKQSREGQSHTGERNARRERGASRNER
jgi:hypothetical protein